MRIGFIGAGKVATALGSYFYSHGLSISGYHDSKPGKAAEACLKTNSRDFSSSAQLAHASDVVLITTVDDQIADVCKKLCASNAVRANHLIGHVSGAHTSLILSGAADLGAAVFSLHPLQAFSQAEKAIADLPKTYFSLEGTNDRLEVLEKMLKKMGNPYFRIAPENKCFYHLSACVFSNYLVTLMDLGARALEKSGIDPRTGFQAMMPLITGTIANIAELGTADALSGPIVRGDLTTLRQHVEALRENQLAEMEQAYRFLGLKTLELAEKSSVHKPENSEDMRLLLKPDAV